MSRFDPRHIQARGQVIIHERAIEQLPVVVVGEPLVKRIANALRHAAMDLPIENQRIDDRPAIVHDEIFLDMDLQRLGIDLHDHSVDAAGSGASFWTEIVGRLQTRLGARLDRSAHRIRLTREFTQRNCFLRDALDMHLTIRKFKVFFSRFEKFGGVFENFLADNFCGFIDGIARDDRAAAGERPRTPIELVRVTCDDIDFIDYSPSCSATVCAKLVK